MWHILHWEIICVISYLRIYVFLYLRNYVITYFSIYAYKIQLCNILKIQPVWFFNWNFSYIFSESLRFIDGWTIYFSNNRSDTHSAYMREYNTPACPLCQKLFMMSLIMGKESVTRFRKCALLFARFLGKMNARTFHFPKDVIRAAQGCVPEHNFSFNNMRHRYMYIYI